MQRTVFIALLAALFAASASAQTLPDKAYQWLLNQQQDTGLVGNQESDDLAGVYTNALAAVCYLHQGDIDRAERVFDFYQKHFAHEFGPDTPGGFPQFANARTGEMLPDKDRWIGDNAWLLIAINHHKQITGSSKYDAMRTGITDWLLALQQPDGGVLSGFTKDGPMTHYSTEGNLDCYAALVDHPEARRRIRAWLDRAMWVERDRRFRMGSTVDESALDTCSWAVAALGPEYAGTFDYAERRFERTVTCDAGGNKVTAFSDFVDRDRVWLEGSGEMAVAYNVAGRDATAAELMGQLEQAMVHSKKWPELVGLPCHTNDPPWQGGTTLIFVPAQAWYLMASWDFNPMQLPTERP